MGVRLRLGTRGSKLAMAQAHAMAAALTAQGHDVEIVPIRTSGDRGDREVLGAFVKEIQVALLENEIDVALHCLKDLPTTPVPGLKLGAFLPREDARDALISRGPGLKRLPSGAVIGTGSVRRTTQIAAQRADLAFKPLVGNVDTRMRKLIEGEYDALILAMAGLKRLGLMEDWANGPYGELTVWPIGPDAMTPCPGQAALVLETRENDGATLEAVSPFNDRDTEICVRAERAYLSRFGGGCSLPVGAYVERTAHGLTLSGWVGPLDGKPWHRQVGSGSPDDPEGFGRRMAESLWSTESATPEAFA